MLTDLQCRIGLGCMRLTDEAVASVVGAALAAGITVFDTARAYGNEELVGHVLRNHPEARVVTKGGMTRPEGNWVPDGRARSIREDCEASLRALGRPIDLYLLHAPDPRVPFATSLRALAQLAEEKLVSAIGVCNLNRRQLKEALDLAPLEAVQVALGNGHDEALRGGVVSLALERGLWVMAHSPLGGVKRATRLQRDKQLRPLGEPAQLVLAWLLSLHPRVIALPGARRPETARSAAEAARLVLSDEARAVLEERFGVPKLQKATGDGEVVMVAGLSGAGKSTWAARLAGYERLNRDERGGTLAALARTLDRKLAGGWRRVVLDNTYLTRAARHDVIAVAARHGLGVRCLWIDISLAEAQRNVIERMLAAHGRLLEPSEMRGDDPTRQPPRALNNQIRQLEPPEEDEGFAAIERIAFARVPEANGIGRAIALDALDRHSLGEGPRLVFDWLPEGDARLHEATRGLDVEVAACTHPAGPPICWCRPPLPGLLLAFMRRHRLQRLTVIGTTTTHRKMAVALGAEFQAALERPTEK